MMPKIYNFDSGKPGKKLLLIAGIHGDEVAPQKSMLRLISEIEAGNIVIKSGALTIIPTANPWAAERNKRMMDVNLNRIMRVHENAALYEEKLANIIAPVIADFDATVDLHTANTSDIPFGFNDYAEQKERADLLDIFGLDHVIYGWNDMYPDPSSSSTDKWANDNGKLCVTIECGKHKGKDSENFAYNAAVRAMQYFDVADIKTTFANAAAKRILMKKMVIFNTGMKFARQFKHMDFVKSGDIIAYNESGPNIIAETDGYMIMPKEPGAEIPGEAFFYFAVNAEPKFCTTHS